MKILKKPHFKKVVLIFFVFTFVVTGIYIVYTTLAATTSTHTFWLSDGSGGLGGKVVSTTGTEGYYINCPSKCQRAYTYATWGVGYKAIPKVGYKFVGWENSPSIRSGIDYTQNPISFSRSRNWNLTAKFAILPDAEAVAPILNSYVTACPLLSGTTVEFGTPPNGYQAVSFFSTGRILVNTTHSYSLSRILEHELYHIYDWRDNGAINWGESLPPNPKPDCFTKVSMY